MALSRLSNFRQIIGKSSRIQQLQNVAGSLMVNRSHHVTPHPLLPHDHEVLRPLYGGRHNVTMLAGDGVGPELMGHVKEVFRYAGVPVDFEEVKCDQTCTDEEFEHAILAIKRNGVAIKGNVENFHSDPGFQSRNVELRTELDLFANVIRVQSIPALHARHSNIDIVIIRENTEGEYSGLEHENVGGVVESLKIITEKKSTRIAKYAFDYAVTHNRKKVTCVHKANIMKLADGLFLECCERVSEFYPDIEFEAMIVDNCSMQMVSRPQQFDVMVLPNLYGNIIANIGVGLIGGAGLVPGTNIGNEYAVFEMGTRNTGRQIMGKNIANPTSMLLAATDMLHHLGLHDDAKVVSDAIWKTIIEDGVHTPDIGGNSSTTDVITAIIKNIQEAKKW